MKLQGIVLKDFSVSVRSLKSSDVSESPDVMTFRRNHYALPVVQSQQEEMILAIIFF